MHVFVTLFSLTNMGKPIEFLEDKMKPKGELTNGTVSTLCGNVSGGHKLKDVSTEALMCPPKDQAHCCLKSCFVLHWVLTTMQDS